VPAGELDDAPPWFTASQQAGWRYAVENMPRGVLKRIDRGVLTIAITRPWRCRRGSIKTRR
jgi:hypothetical protein